MRRILLGIDAIPPSAATRAFCCYGCSDLPYRQRTARTAEAPELAPAAQPEADADSGRPDPHTIARHAVRFWNIPSPLPLLPLEFVKYTLKWGCAS